MPSTVERTNMRIVSTGSASEHTLETRGSVTVTRGSAGAGPRVDAWTSRGGVEVNSRQSELLDGTFVGTSAPVNPSTTNIFARERAVLFRGANDALVAERYVNEDQVQAIEIKYYNRTFGLGARDFLVHFNYVAVDGSGLHSSLRRTPVLVGPREFASLGTVLRIPGGSGRFGFLFFVDANVSATPVSVRNEGDVFVDSFIDA